MVEDDDLDVVALAERRELADAVRVHGVDEHETADGGEVDVGRVDDRHEVGVQGLELAHVAVHGAAETDRGLRIQLARGDHGGKGVEVGVGVGGDELADLHSGSIREVRRRAGGARGRPSGDPIAASGAVRRAAARRARRRRRARRPP